MLVPVSAGPALADPCDLPVPSLDGQPVPGAVPFSAVTPEGTAAALTLMSASVLLKRSGNDRIGVEEEGDTLLCTYTLMNTGTAPALDVRLAALPDRPSPAGETLDDAVPLGDSSDTAPDDGNWTRLAGGDSVTFSQTHPVAGSGEVSP